MRYCTLREIHDPAGQGLEHGKATRDIAMESLDVPAFTSCVGTLLCLSQHRSHIPHACGAQFVSVGGKAYKACDGLYKGTSSYGLFLLYQALNNNELDEIHEKKFVSFQSRRSKSSATAGQADKSRTERGKHSVSSGMAFLNGKLIQTWSRTRNSIALPSCEARGFCKCWGGKFGLYIGRP